MGSHARPALTVTHLSLEPDLATVRVRVGHGGTVPLDLVRTGHRWLVSFSGGRNPLPVMAVAEERSPSPPAAPASSPFPSSAGRE
jgi:hypothetical protein